VQGGICHLSELASSLGIDYHAVAHILDILEGVFLLRRLPPYFADVGKRLVKSPKVYLRDTGVLHSLLDIPFRRRALLSHPKAGASFEGFCIEQVLLHAAAADPSARGFFYRTHTGVEVDLILEVRGRRIPVEVKLGLAPPDTRNLRRCMETLGLARGFVVNLSSEPVEIGRGIWMSGLREFLEDVGLRPRGK
ncbi:MAG: ATP-binding protein, partial [Planctomycetota bacterium]